MASETVTQADRDLFSTITGQLASPRSGADQAALRAIATHRRAAVAELVEAVSDAAQAFEAMGEHAAAEDMRATISRHQAGLGKGDGERAI